jgi:hypothetical protein
VGQVEKVRHALPEDIRALWPSPVSVDVEIEVDEVRFSRDV